MREGSDRAREVVRVERLQRYIRLAGVMLCYLSAYQYTQGPHYWQTAKCQYLVSTYGMVVCIIFTVMGL